MSDLGELQKFLSNPYRESYLDSYVKGSIAYQIQALREKTGLNQTAFGHLIGQPQSVISRLEDTEYGGVNVNTLLNIANRLGIGLQVRFCSFETVLSADVGAAALQVETINDTVNRLIATGASPPLRRDQQNVERREIWQSDPIPSRPAIRDYQGSETLSSGNYIPTPASPVWVLTT